MQPNSVIFLYWLMPIRCPYAGISDILALNSTLYHVDDINTVLKEAARLVKLGGALIAHHDPQKSATMLRFLGKLI
jgi:ubiquinone/menaquinone biosynthesis C-methylase UbiE